MVVSKDQERLAEAFIKDIHLFEGFCDYMYLDIYGFLTIGYGHLISKLEWENKGLLKSSERFILDLSIKPRDEIEHFQFSSKEQENIFTEEQIRKNFEIAEALPFQKKSSRLFLPEKEKREALKKAFEELLLKSIILKAKIKNNNTIKRPPHTDYASPINSLVLSKEECRKLLLQDTNDKILQLQTRETFPHLFEYPLPMQLALLDMAYNLGATGIVKKFPKFTQLIRNKDWSTILKNNEYHRIGVSKERNDHVKKLLEEALVEIKEPAIANIKG